MRLTPIDINLQKNKTGLYSKPAFGHGGEPFWKSDYSKKDKLIVAGTTALGVAGSLAIMTKLQGAKFNLKEFSKYLKNADFLLKKLSQWVSELV